MKKVFKLLCCCFLLFGCKPNEDTPEIIVENVTLVSNETYEDPKNPSNALKKAFNSLSEHVNEQDMEKVSEDVAICFVYDFFTLKNKENGTDIGGLTYLPQSRVEEFSEFALRNYYKNYDTILNELGKKSLPEVINVTVQSKTEAEVEYKNNMYEGYTFNLSVEYADSKIPVEELKTTIQLTCIVYDMKAMVISVK